jgi:hypothetical protein
MVDSLKLLLAALSAIASPPNASPREHTQHALKQMECEKIAFAVSSLRKHHGQPLHLAEGQLQSYGPFIAR